MADQDPADQDPKDPDAAPATPPKDLRFTAAEQGGVRVTRDLSGQGHLARGSGTNMSSMKFSMRAQPRTELDPELQALRSSEDAPPVSAARATPEVIPAPVAPPAPPAPPQPDTPPDGFFGAIKRLFS